MIHSIKLTLMSCVLGFAAFVMTAGAQAQGLQSGGFAQLQGNLRYCDLNRHAQSAAFISWATNGGARAYRAGDLRLTLVHMNPMGRNNHHATAIWNGRRVSVCVPHPDEVVYAIRRNDQYIPIVMHSCGNEVLAYLIAPSVEVQQTVYHNTDDGKGDSDRSAGLGGRTGDTPAVGRDAGLGGRSANGQAPAAGRNASLGARSN